MEVVMPIQHAPVVSQWYKHRDKGYQFQVISIDEETVELQHFDGDLEELDRDAWYELDIEPIEPPEDWTGPMDDIELDDLGYEETNMTDTDWASPLEEHNEIPDEENPDDQQDKKRG
jgi:hypothetical protein